MELAVYYLTTTQSARGVSQSFIHYLQMRCDNLSVFTSAVHMQVFISAFFSRLGFSLFQRKLNPGLGVVKLRVQLPCHMELHAWSGQGGTD